MIRIIIILISLLPLVGCVTPMRLGISEAEWRNFSPEERDKIKSGYHEVSKSKDFEDAMPDGSNLHVRLYGGQVNMPPFSSLYRYTPIEFDIGNGQCQNVTLNSEEGDKKVTLKACYRGKTLYLDPSRYDVSKRVGSIQLHYSPIWDRGFTYQKVSSSGYAHLTGVNVALRKYDQNGPSERED
jgi:hypothetical protein